MKVAFTISDLGLGGAQQVLVTLAQAFVGLGHDVTVITVMSNATDFFRLPDGVSRVALDQEGHSPTALHAIRNNWRRVRTLRRAIESMPADVVVSHMTETSVLSLLAAARRKIPVIPIEQVDPASIPPMWRRLRRLLFGRAAAVVSPSTDIARHFAWLPATRRIVIPNPMPDVGDSMHRASPGRPFVVGLGRLADQKGFDLLVEAFAGLAGRYPHWDLEIIGEGERRGSLEETIRRLGLAGRVRLPGSLKAPWPRVAAAEMFVMSSRFEGLPGALIGAMACGVPAISFDCPTGPREIITDGVDGILVPPENTGMLMSAMERLMADTDLRQAFGQRARDVRARFGLPAISSSWQQLLDRVAA